MRTRVEDVATGKQNEATIKHKLETFFNTVLTKDTNEYAPLDFYNEDKTIFCETKRRFIKHNQYPTVMIGKHKIDSCTEPNAKYYFTWVYNDGIYFIEYNKDKFNGYERRMFARNDRADHIQQDAEHYFIPISDLSEMV